MFQLIWLVFTLIKIIRLAISTLGIVKNEDDNLDEDERKVYLVGMSITIFVSMIAFFAYSYFVRVVVRGRSAIMLAEGNQPKLTHTKNIVYLTPADAPPQEAVNMYRTF